MGTKMGPSYACLFMGHLEHLIFTTFQGPVPYIFRRYIDDGFGVTDISLDDLNHFIDFVSGFHPAIKFTSLISSTSVDFLDICVSIGSTSLTTSVHYKPTASHSFLLYTSSHPRSCRHSLPFSQLLRLRRLCQDDVDFQVQAHKMLDFFRRRLYPEDILSSALQRVLTISRSVDLVPSIKHTSDRPILAITFHPHNMPALRILLRHFSILQLDPISSPAFPSLPLVAFRRDRNLRDLLVHSRLRTSAGQLGTVPCHRHCLTCPFVILTPMLQFPKSHFDIQDSFSCLSRNLIYSIICKRCDMKYIGETGRRLADRFAEHLRDITNHRDSPLANHFNSPSHHGSSDVSVIGLLRCYTGDRQRQYLEYRLIFHMGVLHLMNTS